MPARRAFLAALAAAAASRPAASKSANVGLSYGTYGLKALPWEQSLDAIAEVGYDGVELCIMPGYPTQPRALSASDRKRVKTRLEDRGLRVPAFLETLRAMHPTQTHQQNLELIERAMDLGAAISPDQPPILETTLGRKTEEWDEVRNQMVDEVGRWADVAARGRTTICFKPHAGNAVHNTERSLWLVQQVDSPYFRCTYDYSHLSLAGEDLVESLEALLPVAPYIHVKDARGTPDNHEYLLPGDGTTDYVRYFRTLSRLAYAGWVNVEVSVHVQRKPGYDPLAAARLCYSRLSEAFERAGLDRR